MPKKIALCFLTYDNIAHPKLWKHFITSNYNIYIHNKNEFTGEFQKYCIKNKVETEWGHISLIKATLKLFKEAYQDTENEYFVLLSDKCIPLYNSDEIYNKINKLDNNIITCYGPKSNGYSFFPNWNNRQCESRFNSLNDKSFFDINMFKKQHQWMILKRNTIKFFIDNDYTYIFGNEFIVPDEHYFINIILKYNIPFINKSITFINREEGSDLKKYRKFPKTYSKLTNEMIKKILQIDTLFMRKVESECKLPTYFDPNHFTFKNKLQ
jgi:hypothetical protein